MKPISFSRLQVRVCILCFLLSPMIHVAQPIIGNLELTPALTIHYFNNYTVSVPIDPNNSPIDSVRLIVTPIPCDANTNWDFRTDGTPLPDPNVAMKFIMSKRPSENVWDYTTLRPDHIYPQITFAPYTVTWNNTPTNHLFKQDKFQLLRFTNPFTMTPNAYFYIELYATPVSLSGPPSVDMEVYLVGQGRSASYFVGNWITNSDVELVGTFSISSQFNHNHGPNSYHFLIPLTTNSNARVGNKALNINQDFWIALRTPHHLATRGWNLKVHTSYPNVNSWYEGNGTATPTLQTGSPDVHIHLARNHPNNCVDGVKFDVQVFYNNNIVASSTTYKYFGTIPNLPPNASSFTAPAAGTYSGNVTISWNPATDPNNDPVTYNLKILDNTGTTVVYPAAMGISSTSYSFDTQLLPNGDYDILVEACDAEFCTSFLWSGVFGGGGQYFSVSNSTSTNSWTGSTDSDWFKNSNWLSNVPTATQDVSIPVTTNKPVIDGNTAVAKTLNISSGTSVTINPGGSLTIPLSGALTNNAGNSGLVIKSGPTGTGSLIHNTPDVPATIERYITGSPNLSLLQYHCVSIPLTQSNNPLSGLFLGSYLYYFDASAQQWVGMGSPTNNPLYVNQGYLIYYPANSTTYTFQGTMNSGSFTTSTSPAGSGKFYLVPNPYPSAINWDVVSGWTKQNLNNAIWIWNPGASPSPAYAAYVNGVGTNGGTNIIPVGQSFFVQAASSQTPVLIVNNDARVHSNTGFFKDQTTIPNVLRIKVLVHQFGDEIIIRMLPSATTAFDGWTDADKMYGFEDLPALYSLSSDHHKLAINTVPYTSQTITVPVSLEYTSASEAQLLFEGQESFNSDISLWWYDQLTGAYTDLRLHSSYPFVHDPSGTPERFTLYFNAPTRVPDNQHIDPVVFYSNGYLHVQLPEMGPTEKILNIYSMTGQKVFSSFLPGNVMSLSLPHLSGGIYVVNVISHGQVQFAKKILIP